MAIDWYGVWSVYRACRNDEYSAKYHAIAAWLNNDLDWSLVVVVVVVLVLVLVVVVVVVEVEVEVV